VTVEIICVGTEILLGNIVNTNAAYLSEKCAALGLSCYYQTVVGDNGDRLEEVLGVAIKRSDIVILSGGLGPTEDDLTKETAAKVMGRELFMHEPSKVRLEAHFHLRGMKITDNNWKQAMIPEGSVVLPNPNGTAPGVIIESYSDRQEHPILAIILLPGPPGELIPMFEKSVVPYISNMNPGVILSKTVKICGLGESLVETKILDMIDRQSNPTLATYAKTGEVHIRVTAKADNVLEADAKLRPVVDELCSRFGRHVFTTEEGITLEMALGELLAQKGMTITCAESCTGGLLMGRLVNTPGISKVFKEGFVTYSNKAKRRTLDVTKETLKHYGAVSIETAREMAKGARKRAEADVAIAITGIAGPDGGSAEKPVGSVCIAVAVGKIVTAREFHFSGGRRKVREVSVVSALTMARECVESVQAASGSND
jgi:nicotinamide-nucleotide amidase